MRSTRDILNLLVKHRLAGEVFEGACSVKRRNGDFAVETCALVRIYSVEKGNFLYNFWPEVKHCLSLTCAHVKEFSGDFSGCIMDYAAATRCPYALSSSAACADCKPEDPETLLDSLESAV